jgi:MoaA/NifB/PqqE/SkfB family radical SAM enzyme
MKKLDLKLWYICNNNCDFCIQWEEKRKLYKPKLIEDIKRILSNEYQKWARFVTFTWWEPTMHKTLVPSIEYAKKLWYLTINIQSNWQNFSDIKLCIKLIKVWANSFEPSIHWYKKETHDNLVKTPWAWNKVIKWIINLKKLWQKVYINSVITKQNYKEAPELAKLLVKLNVNYFQYAFPHIWWSAKKYWKIIVPTKTEIKKYIHEWLDIAKNAWIEARTEAIPYCFMQWYEYAITEQYLPEASVYDWAYIIDSFKNYRLNEWKVKHEKCLKCKMNIKCEWPWIEYPELFWWDEFIPII